MAVTGVFAADFSAFDKAVKTSESNLAGLEQAGTKVESSLRLMTQTQEQFLDKIGASGGKIQELGTEATKTGGQVNTLSESYRQFDGMLQAAGINIGPQVKGLEDLANVAGKTASELGAIATAGAIAGAAMTGWKIGELIADVTDLDDAFGNLVSNLMGWGDITTESSRRQEIINKAIELGGTNIRSLADAEKYLAEVRQTNIDKTIDWTQRLADAHREVRNLSDAKKAEIAIAIEANATTAELTHKYGLSALALDLLADKTDKATAAQAKLNAERQKELDAAEKRRVANEAGIAQMETDARLMADRNKFDAEQLEIQNQKLAAGKGYMDQVTQIAKANTDAAAAAATYATEQDALTASNDALVAGMAAQAEAHVAAGEAAEQGTAATVAGYQAVQQQVEITSDGVRGWLELMRATNEANAILKENSLFTTSSQLQRIAAGNTGGTIGAFSGPSFASGVENFEGGLARVHGGEVLANLPKGTSVFPKGAMGANVSNVFNLVDTESNLARRVSEMIMRQIRAGTQLGTA
jgi:hypothetical protein